MAKKSKTLKLSKPKFLNNSGSVKKISKQTALLTAAGVLAVVLFAVSGWLWWTRVFTDSDRIFNDMLANNLKSTSVTRKVTQKNQSSSVDQTVFVDFTGSEVTSQTVTILGEKGFDRQTTTVKTETIGTPSSDYVRYVSAEGAENLSVGNRLDQFLGTWGKRDSTQGEPAFLNEALFSLVPFGNLPADKRDELLGFIQDKKVYTYTTAKRSFEDGRYVYTYTVLINPMALVETLVKYSELAGTGQSSQLNPASYENAAPLGLKMVVDIPTRQLISLDYGTGRVENIENINLNREIILPEQTIPFEELQKRLLGQPATERT